MNRNPVIPPPLTNGETRNTLAGHGNQASNRLFRYRTAIRRGQNPSGGKASHYRFHNSSPLCCNFASRAPPQAHEYVAFARRPTRLTSRAAAPTTAAMAKLYFYFASMNAGKSTVLLQSSFNYRERGMRTLLFTAAVDDRAHVGTIASRIGLTAPATPFDAATDLAAIIAAEHRQARVDCVLVDEAQFLTHPQVWQLAHICDTMNIPVLTYGLRTDFLGALFPGSAALLAIADVLSEIKSVCVCGRKATMNLRIDAAGRAVTSGDQLEIGGNDRYVALCRRHFSDSLAGTFTPFGAAP
jgi:thymidine kinase